MPPQYLHLSDYRKGIGLLSPDWCNFCVGAMEYSLQEYHGHPQGVLCVVTKAFINAYYLTWDTLTHFGGWGQINQGTEYGAYAMAGIMIELLTPYSVADMMPKQIFDNEKYYPGFDCRLILKSRIQAIDDPSYFVKNIDEADARLEVSGTQDQTQAESRLKQKIGQYLKSDMRYPIPALTIITDFQTPKILTDQRHVTPSADSKRPR